MEAITVRRIKPGEWGQQRDIRLRMLSQAPGSFGSTAEEASVFEDEDWKAWAKARAEGSDQAMFVAVAGGDWIGCAMGSRADHDEDSAWVSAMWVDHEWRSQKIAVELLEKVRTWAVSARYRRLELKVAESNQRALRLYERFGFKDTGERSSMKRDRNITMATMRMDLDG
ncbi:MAG TPA: GNAT family N-acetyltransferase [Actinomycetota bacterium]|nr:GNAT family N-acetyltransferase [Actinomycetota bacterium]